MTVPKLKITDIKTHILKSPLETPFAFSQGWVGMRSATLVEVQTDAGITGWGEAFCQGLETPEIGAAAIQTGLVILAAKALLWLL